MQRSRPIVERAIRSPGPLLGRTIPTQFDIVPIWVIDVDGQTDSIISGILDGNTCITHPSNRMCQGRLGWKPQPVVVEPRSFCWGGTLLTWDGPQSDEMGIRSRGKEGLIVAVAHAHLQA